MGRAKKYCPAQFRYAINDDELSQLRSFTTHEALDKYPYQIELIPNGIPIQTMLNWMQQMPEYAPLKVEAFNGKIVLTKKFPDVN